MLETNKGVIEEFRAKAGVCSGWLGGAKVVLVTMTGAKSGRAPCSPLAYSTDGGAMVVIASKGGAPEHANWYLNLTANPDVTVEVGTDKYEAAAKTRQNASASMTPRLRSGGRSWGMKSAPPKQAVSPVFASAQQLTSQGLNAFTRQRRQSDEAAMTATTGHSGPGPGIVLQALTA